MEEVKSEGLTLAPGAASRATDSARAFRRAGGWWLATLRVAWANCVRLSVKAVRVADPHEPLDRLAENLKEELTIRIDLEDGLACVAATRDVIQSSLVLQLRLSPLKELHSNSKLLTTSSQLRRVRA
jgi:hypothetical protein